MVVLQWKENKEQTSAEQSTEVFAMPGKRESTVKYTVELTEANYGTVTIDATSKEDAERQVLDMYLAGTIAWHDTDIEIVARQEEEACP